MKIKINDYDEALYCAYSKQRIQIGEKYIVIEEDYLGEEITKTYKMEYAPTEEEIEDEDPWICDKDSIENEDK